MLYKQGAKLVLTPDRDALGIKYIANFDRDFPSQIEGYYLAGTEGLWRKLPAKGGMDIADEIADHNYTKDQILDRTIGTDKYRELTAKSKPSTEEPDGSKKPHFTTRWDALSDQQRGKNAPSSSI